MAKVQTRWTQVSSNLLGFKHVSLPDNICNEPPPSSPFWNQSLAYVDPLAEGCSVDGETGPMALDKKIKRLDGECAISRNFTRWEHLNIESPGRDSRDSGLSSFDEAPQFEDRPDGSRCRGVLDAGILRNYRNNYADVLSDWHYWVYMRAEWMDYHMGQLGSLFPVEEACVLTK